MTTSNVAIMSKEASDSNASRSINTILAFSAHGCLDSKQIFGPIRHEFALRSNRILVKKDKLSCHLCENLTLPDGQSEDDIDTIIAISNAFTQAFSLGRRQATKLRRAVEKTVLDGSYKIEGIRAIGENLLLQNNDTADGVYDLLYSVVGHNYFCRWRPVCQTGHDKYC